MNLLSTKKDKILKTALELFTVQGYKATTTKEIALKSGVAEGLIFYYFKDKNELLQSLIHEFSFIGSIRDEMQDLSKMEPLQALIQLGHLYSNFLSCNKRFLSFIWSPEMLQNKEVSEKVVDLIHSMSEQITIHITKAVSVQVEKQQIDLASSMFFSSLLTRFLVGERISDEPTLETEYIENVLHLILKGLNHSN